MQRPASSMPGATKASVGQASRQRVQEPHCSATGASAGRSRSVTISASRRYEPCVGVDQAAVLPDPAEARRRGEGALGDRRRVDADARRPRAGQPRAAQRLDDRERLLAQGAVVVGAARVAGEAASRPGRRRGRRSRARRGRRPSARRRGAPRGSRAARACPRGSACRRGGPRRSTAEPLEPRAARPRARCRRA